jgi:perosamine synthetase
MGLPCDLRRLVAVARRFELPIVEDAACAAGSQILWNGQWQPIGRPHGDIACFSFHPRKVISTGDGGMVTTARDDWDRQLRRLRQHGMSLSDAARHGAREVVFEQYPTVGFNYRMTDIQAAVGREQLARLPDLVRERRALAQRYDEQLQAVPRLGRPQEPPWARSNWQSYCVRLPAGVPQRPVMQAMLDAGVATRRGIMCSHREAAYAAQPLAHPLPHSEAAQDGCVLLPLYAGMTAEEQAQVVAALAQACAR